MKRLIATDLDGTLLRSDSSISPRTREALATVKQSGFKVVVVTGRPPRALTDQILDALDTRIICANGALIYDPTSSTVVREMTIAPDIAATVVAALRARMPGLAFAVERPVGWGHEPAYASTLKRAGGEAVIADVQELVREPVAKLLALHPDRDPDTLVAEIREVVSGMVEVTHSSKRGLAEMSAVGVSKALALEELAGELGVAADGVTAFGDMPNDIPMLAWAGWSIAVANAHPEVIAVVDEMTASNDDDGVALVLERLTQARTGPER